MAYAWANQTYDNNFYHTIFLALNIFFLHISCCFFKYLRLFIWREIDKKVPIYNALTNCVLHDPSGPGLGHLLKLRDIPKLFGNNLVVCPAIQGKQN